MMEDVQREGRVLLIDGPNIFTKFYIVNPSVSVNGDPVGGVKGFLSFLLVLCRKVRPDTIIVAWDGEAGSQRRKFLNSEYKKGRSLIADRKLNRLIDVLSVEQEEESRKIQQSMLMNYIQKLPIFQVKLDSLEADDVISYLCKVFDKHQKVIVSSDKDFIQLCDNKTVLFRSTEKEVLTKPRIIKKYGISPSNFSLARAISGDKSDNLVGVPRVGLKTLAKRFPCLKEDKKLGFDFLYEICSDSKSKSLKVYKGILEHKKDIELNYRIMQLYEPFASEEEKIKISNIIKDDYCPLDTTKIYKMMSSDGFFVDLEPLFAFFRVILSKNKNAS